MAYRDQRINNGQLLAIHRSLKPYSICIVEEAGTVVEREMAGGMTPSEAKAIGRAASEMGFDTMSRRLGGEDPIAEIVKVAKADPAKAFKDFRKMHLAIAKKIRR